MSQPSLLKGKARGFSERIVRVLSRLQGEPAWLRQRRQAAWRAYQAMPMPSPQDEDWRRTPLSSIPFDELVPYGEPPKTGELSAALQALLDVGEVSAGHIIQQDSEVVQATLGQAAGQDGVLFSSLADAVRQRPQVARRYLLGEAFPPQRGKFAALNAALFSGGTFLHVPPGVEVTLPLRATRWLATAGLAAFPHTVVVLERGARATLIEEFFSPPLDGPSLLCPGIEIYLEEDAQLSYVLVQQMDAGAFVLATQRSLLGPNSRLHYLAASLGGRLSKQYSDILLRGEGASARLLGVVFGDGQQHFDHQTLQEHTAANASSDLLFTVVVKDRAMSVHYGTVRVHKGARGADAGQTVRNLILSAGAKAHPILPLEIEAADIRRCSHAAAIGQIDEDQLFYLQSRGLSRRQAERLVVLGFFEPVMAAVPLEGVRERLRRAIDNKLPPD